MALGVTTGFAVAAAAVKRVLPSRGDEESDEVALAAIFGGIELVSRARAFRGGSMLAWFGGIAVDLRDVRPRTGRTPVAGIASGRDRSPRAAGLARGVER